WRGIVHPDDREKDERDFALLSQNKQVDSELRIIRKNGDVIWVRVLAQPIWDEKTNSLAGICGAVQNITVRKTAEIGIR
ncbi:PAS domain-containing protein, partial [Escherichia coli]|nr:PAS domain-containing protein [Escherichia coli]